MAPLPRDARPLPTTASAMESASALEAVTATRVAMSSPVTTSTEGECDGRPVSVPAAIVGVVVVRVAPVPRTMPMPVVPPTAPAAIASIMATVVYGFDVRSSLLL